MKNLKHYLNESAKDHEYVIKFAEKPTSEQIDIMKIWLKRYDLKAMSSPDMVGNDHKDFIDVPNRETHEMHIILGMPISPYVLLQDLKLAANISEKFMTIRDINDPLQKYADFDKWNRDSDDAAAEKGLEPAARLSADRFYQDAEQTPADPLFGDQYNKKLLAYLAGVADERPKMEVEPSAPIFSWLQLEDVDPGEPHQDTSDFNAHIDAPKPVSKGDDVLPVDKKYTNKTGTMKDDAIPSVKFYKDAKTGKATQMVKPTGNE